MQLYNTVNDIKSEMEILYRNITGKPSFTAGEADVVYSSIIDAYLIVLMEYGIDNFKFNETDVSVTTTSGTNYVDLDEYIYKVVSGSVRIPENDQLLGLIDEIAIFQTDPDDEFTGVPYAYSYKNSTDPNIMRLRLYPTPDATYTIQLKAMQFPTDVITNFPVHLMSAIKNKAKSLSCLGLGLVQLKPSFDNEYESFLQKIQDGFESDTPKHVGRTFDYNHTGSIENRISD